MRCIAAACATLLCLGDAAAGAQLPVRVPDIYYTPTRQAVADHMLQLAGTGSDDVVVDLGSGDGRIVILAAQKYGARGVGVELDRSLVETSRRSARDGGVAAQVSFVEGDLFEADISTATVVMLYLSASVNLDLEPKLKRELKRELKRGARIVSHQFPIGRWAPDRTVRAIDGTDLLLWTIR